MQAPRVPVLAEDLEMKKLINTYGKTFHTWQVDRGDTLPLGITHPHALLTSALMAPLLLWQPFSEGVLVCDCTTLLPPRVNIHVHMCCARGSPGLFVRMQLICWEWTS